MILCERKASDISVQVELEPEMESLIVWVEDSDGSWVLYPENGRQAMEMFRHPYAYRPEPITDAAWNS